MKGRSRTDDLLEQLFIRRTAASRKRRRTRSEDEEERKFAKVYPTTERMNHQDLAVVVLCTGFRHIPVQFRSSVGPAPKSQKPLQRIKFCLTPSSCSSVQFFSLDEPFDVVIMSRSSLLCVFKYIGVVLL